MEAGARSHRQRTVATWNPTRNKALKPSAPPEREASERQEGTGHGDVVPGCGGDASKGVERCGDGHRGARRPACWWVEARNAGNASNLRTGTGMQQARTRDASTVEAGRNRKDGRTAGVGSSRHGRLRPVGNVQRVSVQTVERHTRKQGMASWRPPRGPGGSTRPRPWGAHSSVHFESHERDFGNASKVRSGDGPRPWGLRGRPTTRYSKSIGTSVSASPKTRSTHSPDRKSVV